jgi:hypothetical protein
MIPVAEIGYVRRSELPNDGPIQRPRRQFSPINSRRVDGVQTGGRFAMVATIPQKRSQMRDDMLKGLPLVLFALDLNIGFNVPSGQSRQLAMARQSPGQKVRHRRSVMLERLDGKSAHLGKILSIAAAQ